MMEAMTCAPLGDDVLGDDPTVKRLEEISAALFGKERGLFFPTGTMANQAAIKCWTQPGDEIIVEERSHTFLFECGGIGVISSVQTRTLPSQRGTFDIPTLKSAFKRENDHSPKTALVCLENSHNFHGGAVVSPEASEAIYGACREWGVPLHVDGARIFNAAIASNTPLATYGKACDSLQFCVSKGLGTPAGSLLVGPADWIAKARRVRKLLGGGMRQTGILAACGIVALEKMVPRLAQDHALAQAIAHGVRKMKRFQLAIDTVETNIVFVKVSGGKAADVTAALAREGLLAIDTAADQFRIVTHKDVGPADGERLLAVLTSLDQA